MSTPLTSPKQIRCPHCRAQAFFNCQRPVKRGSVRIAYMKGFHPARVAEFERVLAANPEATIDPATHPAPGEVPS